MQNEKGSHQMLVVLEVRLAHQTKGRILFDVQIRSSRNRPKGLSEGYGEGKNVGIGRGAKSALVLQRSLYILLVKEKI